MQTLRPLLWLALFLIALCGGIFLLIRLLDPGPLFENSAAREEIVEPALQKYDFYQMLKQIEVSVPDAPSWQQRGIAVLQAGFFYRREYAESRSAELVALGMTPVIQEQEEGFRVLIGPFSTRRSLQEARERLQLENIPVRRIIIRASALQDRVRSSSGSSQGREP